MLKNSTVDEVDRANYIESFRQEAEILFHLSAHIPEVVRPLHVDAMVLDDGGFVPFLAMEWVDGTPLDAIVMLRERRGEPPLSMAKAVQMLTPIAHALSRAHRFQTPGGDVVCVTHCDLKPDNILILPEQSAVSAKILDFGIARARVAARQVAGQITDSSSPHPFTPAYGAPEQWVPKRLGQTGPWTDVWGLAITLVECVVGRPPIEGDNRAMMGTALDAARRPTPRVEGARVNDRVEAAFERALAVDPRDRYPDVESFWSALEDALGLEPSFARRISMESSGTFRADLLEGGGEPSGPLPGPSLSPGLDLAVSAPPPPRTRSHSGTFRSSDQSGAFPAHRLGGPLPRAGFEALRSPPPSLARRFKGPLIAIALAMGVSVLDMVLARVLGSPLALGPIKLRYLAGVLFGAAMLWALSNLVAERDES